MKKKGAENLRARRARGNAGRRDAGTPVIARESPGRVAIFLS